MGSQSHAAAALTLGKSWYPLYKRTWMVPMAGLDGCEKSLPNPPRGFDPQIF